MIPFKSIKTAIAALAISGTVLAVPVSASAGSEPFIGEVMLFASNFCPRNFAKANGQLLPISQNTALFSLLGTQFGGDGRTTFALPDLRGRAPLGEGQMIGGSNYRSGQKVAQSGNATGGTGGVSGLAMNWCIATQGLYPSRS